MRQSIEFPCDRRWVKNPNNNPLATIGERQGAAAQTRLCIATIGLILSECFKAPGPFYAAEDGHMRPNLWTVTLTRISMGTLDPITGGASMKAVQDAVATWCGVKNERDPVWRWVEPIGQEKRGKGFFGVRIVIEDLAPGEPRSVAFKSIDRFVWQAKQRIKEAKMYKTDGAIRKAGRVQTYYPEAGTRAASSAARSKAEAGFARLTGKPTALDLRDAAEGALARQATRPQRITPEMRAASADVIQHRFADPGEERPARDLATCTTCGAEIGQPCQRKILERVIHGVHPARAIAAGLHVPTDDRAYFHKPAPTNGHRRIVPPAQAPLPLPPAVARLPWEASPCTCEWGVRQEAMPDGPPIGGVRCSSCDGHGIRRPTRRDPRHDGEHAPATVRYAVPAEHRARFGSVVTLTRRRTTLAGIGEVWLYE